MPRRAGRPARVRRRDSAAPIPTSSASASLHSENEQVTANASNADTNADADSLHLRLPTALSLSPSREPSALGPRRIPRKPFRFLSLPTEIRLKVYAYHFADTPTVVDLDPDNQKRLHQRLALFRVCRLIHEEASHWFFSTRTFRIFPTYPGRFFKTKRPLLARLREHQRASISSLELRLGPGWSSPPRGWVVNEVLGLRECVGVRRLVVFVECDPSDGVFKGFRQADGFYEGFSSNLLTRILGQIPSVRVVEFDAWPSVKRSGAMMKALMDAVSHFPVVTRWGPERGWTDADDGDEENEINKYDDMDSVESVEGGGALSLSLVDGITEPSISFAGHGTQSVGVLA